jgi:hypothetical protein
VRTLVAHEPPCITLLPDQTEARNFIQSVNEAYSNKGTGAAMETFMKRTGIGNDPPPAATSTPRPPDAQETFGRIRGNLEYFIAHGFSPLGLYVPDISTLRSGYPRIVVGVGAASKGQLAHRTAIALAQQLGTVPISFPGGHSGYNDDPPGFAETLERVLSAPATASSA